MNKNKSFRDKLKEFCRELSPNSDYEKNVEKLMRIIIPEINAAVAKAEDRERERAIKIVSDMTEGFNDISRYS